MTRPRHGSTSPSVSTAASSAAWVAAASSGCTSTHRPGRRVGPVEVGVRPEPAAGAVDLLEHLDGQHPGLLERGGVGHSEVDVGADRPPLRRGRGASAPPSTVSRSRAAALGRRWARGLGGRRRGRAAAGRRRRAAGRRGASVWTTRSRLAAFLARPSRRSSLRSSARLVWIFCGELVGQLLGGGEVDGPGEGVGRETGPVAGRRPTCGRRGGAGGGDHRPCQRARGGEGGDGGGARPDRDGSLGEIATAGGVLHGGSRASCGGRIRRCLSTVRLRGVRRRQRCVKCRSCPDGAWATLQTFDVAVMTIWQPPRHGLRVKHPYGRQS